MPQPWRRALHDYRELGIVLVAAGVGLLVQRPLVWWDHRQGIDTLLVVLVFATALNIEARSLRQLPALWRQLAVALVVGISLLPALSWLVAHLVAHGNLRNGVMTIGLAPCEIASIGTTAIAIGDVTLAGGLLIGSTILTVSAAGPILAIEAPHASIHASHIIANLFIVVAAPLVVGMATRSWVRLPARVESMASGTITVTVAALVALIAAEVHFSKRYLPVVMAIVLFVLVSAVIGWVIGRCSALPARKALLLTTSMRDFAIAAGLAAAAFGPAAAAPLGIYGIAVLVWGTGSAGFMRARTAR
jgi:predicted Na+-dependent transporter